MEPLVIIGTGLAGYRLAKAFRDRDQQRAIHLITTDDGVYYSKPALSTGLRMRKTPHDLMISSVSQMAEQLRADIHTEMSVVAVDTQQKTVSLADGSTLTYGTLVFACGAKPIQLPIPGIDHQQVLMVNSLQDYRRFRQRLSAPQKVLLLGAGLVGSELCNDLVSAQHELSVCALSPYPLDQLLTAEAGAVLQQKFIDQGVQYALGQSVAAIEPHGAQLSVHTDQDKSFVVDTVVSAVGLTPNVALAKAAGIEVQRGIVTDQYGQTSDPDVYALGDCAEVQGLVLYYVAPIMAAAKAIAKTLTGESTRIHYPAMPVVVKTTLCPLVVSPPTPAVVGEWVVVDPGDDFVAHYKDAQGQLHGFILMQAATSQRRELTQQLPDWLPI